MRDKKKLLAILLFLIMGFFMFTFANPSDGISTLTKPVNEEDEETNKEDNKAEEETQVIVVDNAPVITVNPKKVSIAYGTNYNVMTGVTVTDDKDNLVATPSINDTSKLEVGTHTITYTVTDSANHTVTATRTLVVFEDKNNNNLPDEDEEHYDVNFDVDGRGSLKGTTTYSNVLTGLTFVKANIEVPEVVADEYYKFIEWTPVTPSDDTEVTETITYVAVFGPINDVNENGIADEEETYTVTFVDYDGKTIAEVPTLVNTDATVPADPTRSKKNGVSYTFAGWSGDYTNVTEARTITATYRISAIEATVYELKDEFEIPTTSPYYVGSTKNYTKVGTVSLNLTDEMLAITNANKSAAVLAYSMENVMPYINGEMPSVTGYTYNWYVVKHEADGWHIDGKKTINEHTLTVTFNYSRQEKAAETVTKTVKYNEEYNVEVPTITYYTASVTEIKGNMPDEDVTVNVVYTPNHDINNNGIADEEEPHHTVTFVVRGAGKFTNIDRVRSFISRESNEIQMIVYEDEKKIVYSNILEGLTYAEWENSEDGQSYICATTGDTNASTKGIWVDENGQRYNNNAEVYSDNTYYMDYFYDRNNNKIDDETEEKKSVTFEITGTTDAGYFNAKTIESATTAGATIASSTKIVYEVVPGATLNKYGYSNPSVSKASGAKCTPFNPSINKIRTSITEDTTSTSNCYFDKNSNDIDDATEDKYTLTIKVENGTFTDSAKEYFTGKGATVTDTEIKFTDILTGTLYSSVGFDNPSKVKTTGNEGTEVNPTKPSYPNAYQTKVTKDVEYVYTYTYKEFTVNFYDENDNKLGESQTVRYGQAATAPDYEINSTEQYNYTVTWDTEFTSVKRDLDVKAVVTPELRSYNVTFVDYDETAIEEQSVEYGSDAVAPEDPTRDYYTFAGWSGDYTNVTGDVTITATYTPINDINNNGIADEEETYTLTINYVYANGETASEAHTEDVVYNMSYSVVSPVIANYIADQTTVTGTMPHENHNVTVTYEADYSSGLIVSWETLTQGLSHDFDAIALNNGNNLTIKNVAAIYTNNETNDLSRINVWNSDENTTYYANEYMGYYYSVAINRSNVKYIDVTYEVRNENQRPSVFVVRFEQSNGTFTAISLKDVTPSKPESRR